MQDRYAGDIGDYGKFGLLKALQKQGFKIGINWYKTIPQDFEKNANGSYKQSDGKHKIPPKLKSCDEALADKLIRIADSEEKRSIKALEMAKLIPDAVYYHEPISVSPANRMAPESLADTLWS